ncbi:MAG TPA: hypothetical protein VFK97_02280, partial [Candidatus Saccharimonadales bacterium]|nr:hypothetical protein [Candidatus Saccharimonadales bacterium]
MFDETGSRPQPAESHTDRGWPLAKILTALLAVLVVFGAGWLAGRGGLNRNGQSAGAGALNYSSVNQVYDLLKKDYDGNLDQTKLLDGIKAGLISAAGDPYTDYFNPTEARAFNDELAGTITGIGAELGTDDQNNIVIIS